MFNVKEVDNFISAEEADEIVFLSSSNNTWETLPGNDYWTNRTISCRLVYERYNLVLGEYLYELRGRVEKAIKDLYSLSEDIYADTMDIVKWPEGFEQPPHADNMKNIEDPSVEWFNHREFSAFVYLTDDFDGGNLYFPEYDISVRPQVGKLIVYPSDTNHIHGIDKISNGTRYTIASFWTKDKDYFEEWPLDKKETHNH